MKGSGNTEGGVSTFLTGFALAAVSLYFFFDSVRVTAGGGGFFSGYLHQQFAGNNFETGSMGLIFLPFFLGVIALFYNAAQKWAWWLMYSGLGIIVIEMLSRIRFLINMKSSHLMILIVTFAAGAGLMIRSYGEVKKEEKQHEEQKPQ